MSGEGLQCRLGAATCNQGRSESLKNCRGLPIPDGAVLNLIVARGQQALHQPLVANMLKTAEFTYCYTLIKANCGMMQIIHLDSG